MPIFDIEIVYRRGEEAPDGLAADLAEVLGAVMDAAPGKAWIRLHRVRPEDYAENQPGENWPSPVFVTLTASTPPEGEHLDRVAREVSEAVAALLDRRPENVHLLVQPAAKGRIAFGGKVAR